MSIKGNLRTAIEIIIFTFIALGISCDSKKQSKDCNYIDRIKIAQDGEVVKIHYANSIEDECKE